MTTDDQEATVQKLLLSTCTMRLLTAILARLSAEQLRGSVNRQYCKLMDYPSATLKGNELLKHILQSSDKV